MDFEMSYSAKQEEFRDEVRSWLAENVTPEALVDEPDARVTYAARRMLGGRLGMQGWLYPTAPARYGGGGLDPASALIIGEELRRLGLDRPPYYDTGGWLGSETILAWGTEEQKNRLLPPIYRGEVRTWQLLTEPEAGSDLANVRLSARRDGDEFVLAGQKVFVGSAHGAERFWMLTCTDPLASRHENLSWFMIDATLPGITIQPLHVLGDVAEGHKNSVYFDHVRVPEDCLVGGENNGWRVASTHLAIEHGAAGSMEVDPIWDALLAHCRRASRDGRPLIDDPDVRDGLAEISIRLEGVRLLKTRNFWRSSDSSSVAYEGPQSLYVWKQTGLWLTSAILDLIGPAALTDDPELGALSGLAERQQRNGITEIVPAGTMDIQRVLIARGLGVGRPR